jgi:hypothetical protein
MLLTERIDGPRLLLLGERSWRVTWIDWKRQRCFVEPAEGGGKARWLGTSITGASFALSRARCGPRRLATLYRNVIKERAFVREPDVLYVMVKGGDWAFGAQLVDGALLALGTPAADMPARIFTPMVLSGSGAKLSKSLLRAAPDSPAHAGIEE